MNGLAGVCLAFFLINSKAESTSTTQFKKWLLEKQCIATLHLGER